MPDQLTDLVARIGAAVEETTTQTALEDVMSTEDAHPDLALDELWLEPPAVDRVVKRKRPVILATAASVAILVLVAGALLLGSPQPPDDEISTSPFTRIEQAGPSATPVVAPPPPAGLDVVPLTTTAADLATTFRLDGHAFAADQRVAISACAIPASGEAADVDPATCADLGLTLSAPQGEFSTEVEWPVTKRGVLFLAATPDGIASASFTPPSLTARIVEPRGADGRMLVEVSGSDWTAPGDIFIILCPAPASGRVIDSDADACVTDQGGLPFGHTDGSFVERRRLPIPDGSILVAAGAGDESEVAGVVLHAPTIDVERQGDPGDDLSIIRVRGSHWTDPEISILACPPPASGRETDIDDTACDVIASPVTHVGGEFVVDLGLDIPAAGVSVVAGGGSGAERSVVFIEVDG